MSQNHHIDAITIWTEQICQVYSIMLSSTTALESHHHNHHHSVEVPTLYEYMGLEYDDIMEKQDEESRQASIFFAMEEKLSETRRIRKRDVAVAGGHRDEWAEDTISITSGVASCLFNRECRSVYHKRFHLRLSRMSKDTPSRKDVASRMQELKATCDW
ncbi:hypothetical protein CH35J_004877 [Colletotrichum higginsianum]|nr:hypothetical protein CH35J_004877 [Colletotrichum higginsianum]